MIGTCRHTPNHRHDVLTAPTTRKTEVTKWEGLASYCLDACGPSWPRPSVVITATMVILMAEIMQGRALTYSQSWGSRSTHPKTNFRLSDVHKPGMRGGGRTWAWKPQHVKNRSTQVEGSERSDDDQPNKAIITRRFQPSLTHFPRPKEDANVGGVESAEKNHTTSEEVEPSASPRRFRWRWRWPRAGSPSACASRSWKKVPTCRTLAAVAGVTKRSEGKRTNKPKKKWRENDKKKRWREKDKQKKWREKSRGRESGG